MNALVCDLCFMDWTQAVDRLCPVTPFGSHLFPPVNDLAGSVNTMKDGK